MKAQLENWEQVRSAYQVARLGTVSAAAQSIGVHHATVIRHIAALESELGAKLFQRHARGYTPTEAGRDLLRVAGATEDQFEQMAGRIRGRGAAVSGELVVTALAVLAPEITCWLARFQRQHPQLAISLIADDRRLRLEYGEAHVALRAGERPQEPDNVVQPLLSVDNALYASADYVARYGRLDDEDAIAKHWFISTIDPIRRAPFARWLQEHVPEDRISFRASHVSGFIDAMRAGLGIGPLSLWTARAHPDLVQVKAPLAEWLSDFWLVTHVDLHRTAKVQACLAHFKDEAARVRGELASAGAD